jgi:hypothetical protein
MPPEQRREAGRRAESGRHSQSIEPSRANQRRNVQVTDQPVVV